ncbi:hypothetical protein CAEBREN_24058 [Caenorhabditis brenneri]|uniref:GH18 domain-containing protein n=1 Tax=Caenorhabditis brenneri TaxID=135651 RepID=G0NN51_CAEBE|nr:hypothetical protein CAEBREN_24058 [Caenorhabditis brenneri]
MTIPGDGPCEKRIVGYYHLTDAREVTISQLSKLTHLIIWAVQYQLNGNLGFGNSNEKENFKKITAKAKPFKVKTMFTLEIGDYGSKNIPELMRNENKREILINAIVTFIRENELDGVNLHWEPPKTEEVQWFITTLCKDIRNALTRLQESTRRCCPYTISLICQRQKVMLNFDEVLKYVDFLNLETDTYYAPWYGRSWNELIGPPTPLYSGFGENSQENLDGTMKLYSCLTKKPNQLNVLVNFSGRIWRNVILPKNPNDTLWMWAESRNGEVDGSWEFWRDLQAKGWNIRNASWNNESKTPYIWDPEKRIYMAFENERSIQEKMKYLEDKNIGGITTWSITRDDDMDTLLDVMVDAKLCSRKNNKDVMFNCR